VPVRDADQQVVAAVSVRRRSAGCAWKSDQFLPQLLGQAADAVAQTIDW
jgi:DNA-binding IclR family transcriptional regulator